jgi:glycosyltransferase involved in cell wall biosynthesis
MRGGGGEEVFVRELVDDPPPGVSYSLVLDAHRGVPGAHALRFAEVTFNRLVHPFLWPLPGLRAYRVDSSFALVHVHNYASHISSRRAVPVVMSVGGGSYYHYVREYLGWSEARTDALYRRAARVMPALGITNEFVNWRRLRGIFVRSEFSRGFLLRLGVPPERVWVIPPGFATPPLPVRPDPSPFRFLLVGRDPARKGADLAIAAARSLLARGSDLRLTLVGHQSWQDLAGERGFEVFPWLDRRRLYEEFYPQSHALLMPSRVEGFGLAAIEAMSFGLPVVASRYGAFPETVVSGVTGVLVPPGDTAALEAAMEQLTRDPAAAARMGAAGRARFEAEYTRERFHQRLNRFYTWALGNG